MGNQGLSRFWMEKRCPCGSAPDCSSRAGMPLRHRLDLERRQCVDTHLPARPVLQRQPSAVLELALHERRIEIVFRRRNGLAEIAVWRHIPRRPAATGCIGHRKCQRVVGALASPDVAGPQCHEQHVIGDALGNGMCWRSAPSTSMRPSTKTGGNATGLAEDASP